MSGYNRTTFESNGTVEAVVCVGDKTSHGGVVIEGTDLWTENSVKVALSGFKVFCPKCKPHTHFITKTSSNCPVHEIGDIALNGDLTSCGATLIAQTATAEEMKHAMQDHQKDRAYDQHFKLIDEITKKPLVNHKYRIIYPGGVIESSTDSNGLTATVKSETADTVQLEIIQ